MSFDFQVTFTESGNAGANLARAARNIGRISGFVDALATQFSSGIAATAPRDTGVLAATASRVYREGRRDSDDYAVRVGSFAHMGSPRARPKRGTIRRFIDENDRNGDLRGIAPRIHRAAWWYLTGKGRTLLRGARFAGMYGGELGKPNYWIALHSGTVPSRRGINLPPNTFIVDVHAAAARSHAVASARIRRDVL